ncbi:MAG TPA: hypothetical protein VLV83_05210 [Acidobacteriota bacterium]|nr:hypothetical protein [Acidobacteriota bacterium]
MLVGIGSNLAAQPQLVILTGTDEEHNGLPVLTHHPQAEAIRQTLSSGFPLRIVRLYRLVQNFRSLRDGIEVEPAYLYLSENQGGFPRYGFILEGEEKPEAAYVDLHKSSPLTGRFGAVDQIFPHELGHVFIRQLIGELGDGGANQIHATALRTDPIVAFNEGFAEHFQIMALDAPDAPPETARLADDEESRLRAVDNLHRYRQALESYFSPGAPARMRFLFWFSQTEDLLRYHWVKANAFARQPRIPDRLLRGGDPYEAYLIQGVFPGLAEGPAKPSSILVSTEGVVSALFYRWVSDSTIRQSRSGPDFFARFGTLSEEVPDLENAYLKLFSVFDSDKPQDVMALIAAYKKSFPQEAQALDRLVNEVFLGQSLTRSPQIWLANPDFKTGTTLFDQYRGLPRTHTFDINAASLVDLMGVPGMSLEVADRIQRTAPYSSLDELEKKAGLPDAMATALRRMSDAMQELRSSQEQGGDLSLQTILMPYILRALLVLGVCWGLAAALYRSVRRIAWWRALLNGLAASFLLLASAWFLEDFAGWESLAATLLVLGVPATLWQVLRKRRLRPAMTTLAAWAAATLPAAISTQTWI